jgi:excisionase family DNA binding protein
MLEAAQLELNMKIAPKFASGSPSNAELLTVEDVAENLKVPVSWVYERTRQRGLNRLPGFRLGKYWRFREAEVLAWLDRQRAGGHPGD